MTDDTRAELAKALWRIHAGKEKHARVLLAPGDEPSNLKRSALRFACRKRIEIEAWTRGGTFHIVLLSDCST